MSGGDGSCVDGAARREVCSDGSSKHFWAVLIVGSIPHFILWFRQWRSTGLAPRPTGTRECARRPRRPRRWQILDLQSRQVAASGPG